VLDKNSDLQLREEKDTPALMALLMFVTFSNNCSTVSFHNIIQVGLMTVIK